MGVVKLARKIVSIVLGIIFGALAVLLALLADDENVLSWAVPFVFSVVMLAVAYLIYPDKS